MNPLIDVAAFRALLDSDTPPTVLDVRWNLAGPPGIDEYTAGHIPGSVFCDLETDLTDPSIPPEVAGRHPLPNAERFAASMRALGVSGDRTVVVYDASDSTAAARAWWSLTYFGHSDVRVLDGGFAAWVADGGAVTTDVPVVDELPADAFVADAGHLGVLPTDEVLAAADNGVLLDARKEERYRGDVEPMDPIAGHIPGAVTASTWDNVGDDGRFLSSDALRDRFAQLGAGEDADVAVYCGSGVTAAHEVLALSIAGIDARLWLESWSLWSRTPGTPVNTGPNR